jgi:hypothetical protein
LPIPPLPFILYRHLLPIAPDKYPQSPAKTTLKSTASLSTITAPYI